MRLDNLACLWCSLLLVASTPSLAKDLNVFNSKIELLPHELQIELQNDAWHPGCPLPLSDLRYVELSYWGFDHKSHMGFIVINVALAPDIAEIFKNLFAQHFPLQLRAPFNKADPAVANENSGGNSLESFNCREVTGQPGKFSQHSYGRALDINPLINPYVAGKLVIPQEGASYVNRDKPLPGMISKDSVIYHEFMIRGWDWGGNWDDTHDYMHFEKRANGEKRNPHGYGKSPFSGVRSD